MGETLEKTIEYPVITSVEDYLLEFHNDGIFLIDGIYYNFYGEMSYEPYSNLEDLCMDVYGAIEELVELQNPENWYPFEQDDSVLKGLNIKRYIY